MSKTLESCPGSEDRSKGGKRSREEKKSKLGPGPALGKTSPRRADEATTGATGEWKKKAGGKSEKRMVQLPMEEEKPGSP